jgi:exopolyphosphatase/pppGpp-phosphohydrolase
MATTLAYQTIRHGLGDGTPITVLHIGEQETTLATGSGAAPDTTLVLAIGTVKTAEEFFIHSPPRPIELENAIMCVEDEVTRARDMLRRDALLFTTDVAIRDIAHVAGLAGAAQLLLPIEAIEQNFGLLAAVSLGKPASSAGIPGSTSFAATLLILREFMHHLRFDAINIKS